jgi:SAM-dependent methyltransferase
MLDAWSKAVAKAMLLIDVRRWRQGQQRHLLQWPPVGLVRFGNLRRATPISRVFGFDRGQPIDRYYIEKFLIRHGDDIAGRVLEIGDDAATRKFGGDRVTKSDVLHVREGNPQATIVGDLAHADHIPSTIFDCIICVQTLQFIYELRPSIQTLYRLLKPDGVLLVTMPGISQISRYDMDRWGDYWRFTTMSAQRLFQEVFPPANVTVEAYGNVLAAAAFLHGLAAQELHPEELDHRDPDYELLIAVSAVKPKVA